jgi:hypothetical protein
MTKPRSRFKVFPRYRRSSLKTVFGVTRAKRRIKTATGYYAATRWTHAPRNLKRRMLRRAGYNSGLATFLRFVFGRRGR